ncbi:MAG: GNAT family N-acetyltransferase [bacterium]|nr:GNAT family N-acetyltransferase [bacterium]
MTGMNLCANLDAASSLRRAYLTSLRGPQEAWLQEQVYCRDTEFWEFTLGTQVIGYCCVERPKQLLLQFFVSEEYARYAEDAFEEMLRETGTKLAYVSTRDPLALSLSLTYQHQVSLESYLFEHRIVTSHVPSGLPRATFRNANDEDIQDIIAASGDFWGDIVLTVQGGQLRVLGSEDTLFGMGYVSTEYCSEGTANLGVFTNPNFRRKGVGTFIVQELVQECRSRGLSPIAACYHENVGSKGTLARAGFVSYDRMFMVSFTAPST